jgi:hypothetical protein
MAARLADGDATAVDILLCCLNNWGDTLKRVIISLVNRIVL